ncbi:LacI family DNA-binding transcriptional regulator [Paenibacillus harenae]|uniref:LacI family DNA-binding transcriptional regulator n=1 Tax=Paenibacillus harenae TaxID=306543 RepID=UPI00048C8DBE|nr:LacI family DNA-binding transcriptional regulator [Paenibacillus harenae]
MKKATLKDIAKAAGVSVATVSYVLNNAPNQTIPDETRCRVLDAAKQLNYVPNLTARSLVMQKSGLIGILINRPESDGSWSRLRHAHFVDGLERLLTERGYHVILSGLDAANPKLDIISERKLDGVFVVDAKKESFHLISSRFSEGVPLIAVDSVIDDPLFYKLNYDYEDAFTKLGASVNLEQSYLIAEDFNNAELAASITRSSGIPADRTHVMKNEERLRQFLAINTNRTGIVLNEFTSAIAAQHVDPAKLAVICTAGCPDIVPHAASRIAFGSRKPEAAFELMLQLLDDPGSGPKQKYIQIKAVNG